MDKSPLRWLPLPTTQSTLSDLVRHISDVSSFDQEWKDLRFAPWRFFYLDYHHLQQDKNLPRRLETEWIKVYEFYILKMGEIERRSCQQEPKEQEINTLIKDIHQLYHFAKLNYCGFLSLFMQYHRLFGSGPPSDSLRRLIINKPFWDHSSDLFALIVRLSNLCINYYPLQPMDYKQKRLDSSSSSTTTVRSSETASSHEKTIKKYWVHPDNIVELMLFLSSNKMIIQDHQNNPSSTFMSADEVGHPQGIKSKSAESIHHVKNKIKKEIYSGRVKLTTVYMDSPDLGDYTERLVGQVDTLSCIKTTRIRWYDNVPCLSVEQKIYYNQQQIRHKGLGKEPEHQCCDALTTLSWVQQRIWFKHKHIQSWLNGNYSVSNLLAKTSCQYRADGAPTLIAENRQRMKQTCLQIQDEIHNKIKIPILKSTQYRTVYASSDEQVTISIDTDIIMTRPQQQDTLRFPYCLVQIEQTKPQEWLSKLEASPMLEPVYDFSLYLHGVGILYQVHVFPNWLSKMDTLDIRHTGYRGSLLFIKEAHEPSWSSDTIATIVTCYDDDDDIKDTSPSSSSSSLLSPVPRQQGKLRRSFDSYCSFDHPTSSRSDPTNCKSCMGKMMNDNHRIYAFRKKRDDNAECITFFSVVKDAICRYRGHGHGGEKEPLLLARYKQDTEAGTINYNDYFMGFSRPTVITAACVFTSFTISYLLYIFIMKIK